MSTEKGKIQVKQIRGTDYEILRKYAFHNDTNIKSALELSLENLKNSSNLDMVFISLSSNEDATRSVRISKDAADILKEISFDTKKSMLDVISAAVLQLEKIDQ